MSLREIRILGDPVLREPAQAVGELSDGIRDLVEDMFETMYHAEGVGLAAPQIGISDRVIVVDVRSADEDGVGALALINPRVVEFSRATDREPEGCLSIPGMEEVVERPSTVTVEGLSPDGEDVTLEVSGLLSRAIQHEIDHLDGILFIDRVSPLKRRLLMRKWQKSRAEEEGS
jgi:peptide deformylase